MKMNTFDRESLLLRPELLQTGFIPERILFRDEQINKLVTTFSPILRGYQPKNVVLLGQSNTGKTIVANKILKDLREKINHETIDLEIIDTSYSIVFSPERAIQNVIYRITNDDTIYETELNEQQLVSKLIDILETKEMSLLIVDHSVPGKKSKDYLKLLFDAQAFLQTRNTNVFVSFLLIIDSNIENWQTDDNYITIFFYPYSKEEVEKIVFDRKDAFKEGAISDEMIKKCITAVPNSISEIFSLLLDATIIAESKNANSVTNEHLDNSLKTRKAETIMGIINILPPSQRIVLLIIATLSSEKKEVHASDIYNRYVSFCEKENINALSKPRISQIIGGFEETGILTRKVSYEGIPGRLSIITLNIQSEYLREMLSEVSK